MALQNAELPNELLRALDAFTGVLNSKNVTYALIGGLSLALRGQIRPTRDVDVLLTVPQLELPNLLEALVKAGFDLDVRDSIEKWNREHLLQIRFGRICVDWLKPVVPVFERILKRAKWEEVRGQSICVADAEGLLLLKLIAFRPRDQEDIRGILTANPETLDLDWVRTEWSQIADVDDIRSAQFEQFVHEYYNAGKPDS